MTIAQITVDAVADMIYFLLDWEVSRIVIGLSLALWALTQVFATLGHIGLNPLAGDAEKARWLYRQRTIGANEARSGPVDNSDDDESDYRI
jgi:hypothetical protein